MKCDVCGWPAAGFELVAGRCHKCTHGVLSQAVRDLLKFHPQSPETGAELPKECWAEDYRRAVESAEREVNKGVDVPAPAP